MKIPASYIVALKYALVAIIIGLTFFVFGWHLYTNPEQLSTLTNLDPLTLVLLAIGYCLFTLCNSVILFYSLRFIGKHVPLLDNILLSGYSSIVNFFGPLQSGPGFRAVYLKKRYGVKLRDFFAATLIFYGFFALINGTIIALSVLTTFSSPFFYVLATSITSIVIFLAYLAAIRIDRVRQAIHKIHLYDRNFWLIGVTALIFTTVIVGVYHIEISHVNSHITILQTVIYTAAANLALFVSLTPGAIGIRESFLYLSQQLHGIDTGTIIGASIIDRAFYVIFLLFLFLLLLSINANKQLRASSAVTTKK